MSKEFFRYVTDEPKDNLEAALNLFFIKDHETYVRGGGPAPEYNDVSLDDYIRLVVDTHSPVVTHPVEDEIELPESNSDLSYAMAEWVIDGIETKEGVLATFYTAAWAYAELRERLGKYEMLGSPEVLAEMKARLEGLEK